MLAKEQANGLDREVDSTGREFIQLGKFKLALDQYLKAYKLSPGNTKIISSIGAFCKRLPSNREKGR